MAAALEFCEITKQYRRWLQPARVALDSLSLSVERGEIFGFLGANGAGKTTAIHIALGLLRATRGTAEMLGHHVGHVATRRRVGFLGENVALYPRSATSVLRFYGALNGMRDPVLRERVRDVLQAVDLSDRAGENTKRMSRGMQQRIGIAQSLVNDPELVILDEPTSALDPFARIAVRELLVSLRDRGKTVFVSSHLLSEIEQVCDRVAILRQGKVVSSGRVSELLEDRDRYEIRFRREGSESAQTVDAAEQRGAIEKIWAAGGEIVSVTPLRRSLEDLFVDLARPADTHGEGAE